MTLGKVVCFFLVTFVLTFKANTVKLKAEAGLDQ